MRSILNRPKSCIYDREKRNWIDGIYFFEPRFWSRVNKNGPIGPLGQCWIWKGTKKKCYEGTIKIFYGKFSTGIRGDDQFAHRISYELIKGSIPNAYVLDHLCRNSLCVNPDHLDPVISKINILRGFSPSAINNRKKRCLYGHVFDSNNTYMHEGKRKCRICHAKQERNRRKIKRNLKIVEKGQP